MDAGPATLPTGGERMGSAARRHFFYAGGMKMDWILILTALSVVLALFGV